MENRNIPSIAYKYKNKNKRPPTLAKEGIEITNVLKIILNSLNLLTNLNILPILNDLIAVAEDPISEPAA